MTDPTVDKPESAGSPDTTGQAPEPRRGDAALDRLRDVVEAPVNVASPDEVRPEATGVETEKPGIGDDPQGEPAVVEPVAEQLAEAQQTALQPRDVEAAKVGDGAMAPADEAEATPDPIPHSIEAAPEKKRPRSRRPIVLASILLLGIAGSLMTAKWQADLPATTAPDVPPIAVDVGTGGSNAPGGLLEMGEDLLKAEVGGDIGSEGEQKDDAEAAPAPAPVAQDGAIIDVASAWQPIEAPDRASIEAWMAEQSAEADSASDKIRPIGDMARDLVSLDNPDRDQYLVAVVRRMGFDPAFELWVTNPDTVDAAEEAVGIYTRAQTAIQAIQTAVDVHPGMEGQQDLHYMMAKAAIESDFVYRAPADGSSGKGLFQFIDSTWLTQFYHHGAKYGYGDLAEQIELVGGKPVIEDGAVKQQILDLRSHPLVNTLIAVDYTLGNDQLMQRRLPDGHQIGHAERYLAHWLGPRGGVDFMNQVLNRPSHAAADYFVSVSRVSGNRSMFYFRGGSKRSFAQVYDRAESKITDAIDQLLSSRTEYLAEYKTSVVSAIGDGQTVAALDGQVVETGGDRPPIPPRKPSGLGGPTG